MRYEQFVAAVGSFPVISKDLLDHLSWSPEQQNLQLVRWTGQGRLIRLKRGIYVLPTEKQKIKFSRLWLANALYSPSYLSLEFILSWHDLIPERVSVLTSVSRKKTATFDNPLGHFEYHHVRDELFFGFEEKKDEFGALVLMASPEKALLDLAYLKPGWELSKTYLLKALRLQQLESLRKNELKKLGRRFTSKKIAQTVELILSLI